MAATKHTKFLLKFFSYVTIRHPVSNLHHLYKVLVLTLEHCYGD